MMIATQLIREMAAADVAPAAELLRRDDFGDRQSFFEWALTQPNVKPFVAEDDGRIVGTGVASAHGATGWVGVIFVAPECRGGGLGRRITRTVIDHLEANGARSIILIASPMGQPIYEGEGFRVLEQQVRFTIEGRSPAETPPDPRLRPFAPSDLKALVALDRSVTGEDRASVIRALVDPTTTTVALGRLGEIRGYLTRAPWRGGAVIAPDPNDALRLLERRRYGTGISGRAGAGVLASNAVGRERLRAAGWDEELGHVRMIRGEPLDWRPEGIWGQFNGALG